jgi:PAS domain S-box-containing protein
MARSPLVVYLDGDAAMRRAVRALLVADGFAVEAVADPEAARARLATEPSPRCIVVPSADARARVAPAADVPVVLFAPGADDGDGPSAVDRRGEDALVRLRAAVRATGADPVLSADEYRTVGAAIQDPVYVLDDEGRFVRVNDAFVDLVGHSRDALLGSHVSLVKDEEAVAFAADQMRALLADADRESARFEVDLTAADGTVRRCEDHVALLPAPGDEFVGSAGVLRDVTERHERERRLSRERDRVRLLFDRTPLPVVRFRLDDGVPVVEETNPAFDLTFGETPAPGVPVDDVHVPDDEREAAARINRQVRAGDPVEAEVTRETVDGPREFLVHVATNETDGVVDEGYASYVDVTEQAAYEAALARQTRWLEGFADVFSHDLRNPLNTARGNVDLAREALPEAETAVRDRLDAADRALSRATELVADLSDALRAGTVEVDPEPVDLGALAREVWATLDADPAALDADAAPRIRADRLAVKRLLENLLRNAVEHGSTNDRTAERSGDAAEDGPPDVRVAVRALPGGFCVDDDGPGIPPAERESVFAPGYTTAEDGSGVGLLSVRQIALAHDWEVAVRENPSGGARIAVTGVEAAHASE